MLFLTSMYIRVLDLRQNCTTIFLLPALYNNMEEVNSFRGATIKKQHWDKPFIYSFHNNAKCLQKTSCDLFQQGLHNNGRKKDVLVFFHVLS